MQRQPRQPRPHPDRVRLGRRLPRPHGGLLSLHRVRRDNLHDVRAQDHAGGAVAGEITFSRVSFELKFSGPHLTIIRFSRQAKNFLKKYEFWKILIVWSSISGEKGLYLIIRNNR